VSLNTIIEELETLIGKKTIIEHKPFHIADLMETWADIEKAKNLLGWEPKISLDEGLEKSISWYMENCKWLKEIKV
jgi:UDP-glucuronate 4-epimerase